MNDFKVAWRGIKITVHTSHDNQLLFLSTDSGGQKIIGEIAVDLLTGQNFADELKTILRGNKVEGMKE